jgi:hypothetical protein
MSDSTATGYGIEILLLNSTEQDFSFLYSIYAESGVHLTPNPVGASSKVFGVRR